MRRALVFLLLAAGLVACHPTRAELRDVVGEGRALLRDRVCDQVSDRDFQSRRALFLATADQVAPEGSN